MIIIDIELKGHNRIRNFFHKPYDRLEDIVFSAIQRIPEKFIPNWLMDRFEKYLDKRINELRQESIKMTWCNMYLQNSLTEIQNRQQGAKEAPSDE